MTKEDLKKYVGKQFWLKYKGGPNTDLGGLFLRHIDDKKIVFISGSLRQTVWKFGTKYIVNIVPYILPNYYNFVATIEIEY